VKRTIEHFLEDIIEHSQMANDFVIDVTLDEFKTDKMRFMATTRTLEIVGEALNHIPEDIRNKYPQIAWRDVIGLRNKIAHVYFGLNSEIVYYAAKDEVFQLIEHISLILQDYRDGVI